MNLRPPQLLIAVIAGVAIVTIAISVIDRFVRSPALKVLVYGLLLVAIYISWVRSYRRAQK